MKCATFFITILSLGILIQSCNIPNCLNGSNNEIQKKIELDDITEIVLGVPAVMTISQGNTQSINLKGDDNIIDNLISDSKVKNGRWYVNIDGCINNINLDIDVTLPKIESLNIDGSGKIKSKNQLSSENLNLAINGSGKIDLDLRAQETEAKISGSGMVELKGQTEKYLVRISGSGKVRSRSLVSQECSIGISGSGNCKVHASKSLNVDIGGSGSVCYKGNPKVSKDIDGSGKVKECN